ncbi:conserved hypothetical protein [Coccidioides posadasii str. Silveira]|uniref:Uncharacterized protein n=1 Tax=Coccidioides posadasii (strain RMSCC 757 / Silveira) TaxID=443226 RepID=E9DH06_COCPS|nr:conserved hypothetical protein [Coccidioides posadasii str. Silveira]
MARRNENLTLDQPRQHYSPGSEGRFVLRRSASVPSIHPHGETELFTVEDDITTEQLAVIEHLEKLHCDEMAGWQTTLSGHAKELSEIRSKLAKATNRGKLRKKSAKQRAQSRDAEISSLKEELANQKQCNDTIETWAAEAEEAVVDMKQHVNSLTFQLKSMRDQREQLAARVNHLMETNTALRKKNKVAAKQMRNTEHEMNLTNKLLWMRLFNRGRKQV